MEINKCNSEEEQPRFRLTGTQANQLPKDINLFLNLPLNYSENSEVRVRQQTAGWRPDRDVALSGSESDDRYRNIGRELQLRNKWFYGHFSGLNGSSNLRR